MLASAATPEDQLEWCGLVESKVRHLIGNLERNQHIKLAHVNPECFPINKSDDEVPTIQPATPSPTETSSSDLTPPENSATAETPATSATSNSAATTPSTPATVKSGKGEGLGSMWFIGLVFAKTEHLNVDLTYDILSFKETGV